MLPVSNSLALNSSRDANSTNKKILGFRREKTKILTTKTLVCVDE